MEWIIVCFSLWSISADFLIRAQTPHRTNKNVCKLTHTGLEYKGTIHYTESGIVCRNWEYKGFDYVNFIHKELTDDDFPEKDKHLAKNYCRNIRGLHSVPWCFTPDTEEVLYEICTVPLCNFGCQVTMLGAEYGGRQNQSLTGRNCVKWSEKTYRKYLKKQKTSTSERVLLDETFPELSRKKAMNFCRNPTGDPNGPWCMVESDFTPTDKFEKEYCEVTLCKSSNCTAGTSRIHNKETYSHFISLNNATNFEFSILLWNIDLKNVTFNIIFCAYLLPLNGENIIDMYNGIEILIEKNRIAFVHGKKQNPNYENIPNLLSGVDKRTFTVTWYPIDGYMTLKMSDSYSILQANYSAQENKDKTIMGQEKNILSYYSISGDVGMWDLPCGLHSQQREEISEIPEEDIESPTLCTEEITIQPYCNFHRKMNKTSVGHEVPFVVRSDHTVYVELRNSPNSEFPYFRIEIFGALNKTSIAVFVDDDSLPEYLHSSTYVNILSYWSWSQFQLSASENSLRLDWIQLLIPSETVFDIKHELVANAKWYSICSKGTAHWMFHCELQDVPLLPLQELPECAQSKKAEIYEGKQWVSSSGQPCFPWIYEGVIEQTNDLSFTKASREQIKNYCRNIDGDENGPYCYIADVDSLPDLEMKKESCIIRSCPASQCRLTGIGREYDGDLQVTRSGRICKSWASVNVTFPVNVYAANLTENYCRNPDDQLSGPWCYTTDPLVPEDLCDVQDCFVNDACTIVTNDDSIAVGPDKRFYLQPEWISDRFHFKVKTWDPLREAGIAIVLAYENSFEHFALKIGIENNTKIELVYHSDDEFEGDDISLQHQLVTKLIPSGYWQGFWIRVPPNNIELGYEGSTTSIFSYEHPSDSPIPYTFVRFIGFVNLDTYSVGINFPCSYCLIEEVKWKSLVGSVTHPINMWSETNSPSKTLTLHMQTKGIYDYSFTEIALYELIIPKSLVLFINSTDIILFNQTNPSIIYDRKTLHHSILTENYWNTITIKFNDTDIQISDQHEALLHWKSTERALNFYYFAVNNDGLNETIWVANCHRPVIDEPPIDGNWSEWGEWTCNVHCGGGLGVRYRKCNNPTPNFNGKPCIGANTEDGECNKFECGCINPTSIDKAKKLLELQAVNKEVEEWGSITLECDKNILQEIKIDSPGSHIQWLKNGFSIKNNKKKLENLDLSKIDLKLSDLQEDDSAVYICIINPDCIPPSNSTMIPISIVALVVNSSQIHHVHETTTFQLLCKGLPLSYIYTDLSQSWELDNELLIDYTTTDLAEANLDNLFDVEPYYTGTWQCKIYQTKLKFTWITNRFRIQVTEPPTIWTLLSEEDAPSIIFRGWNHNLIIAFLWSVIVLEIVAVTYIVYWYYTTRQELLGNT